MKPSIFLLIFFAINFVHQANAQMSISGVIYDDNTSERIVGAYIKVVEGKETFSRDDGSFSIRVARSGAYDIYVSCMGYSPLQQTIDVQRDTCLTLRLLPSVKNLQEVVITASSQHSRNRRIGVSAIMPIKMKELPALVGEKDPLKSLQFLPGIVPTAEGKSDMSIRGGMGDQNLILLDGMPILNANHALGLLSTINPETVRSIKLYKSYLPARFWGRASSVIDIRTKDGNKRDWHGSAEVGTISGKIHLEVPVIKEKTSLSMSARRSLLDLFLPSMMKEKKEKTLFDFYDINGKLDHRFNDRTTVFAEGYISSDCLSNEYKETQTKVPTMKKWRWRSHALQVGTSYRMHNDWTFALSLVRSGYEREDNQSSNEGKNDSNYGSETITRQVKYDVRYEPSHSLNFQIGAEWQNNKISQWCDIGTQKEKRPPIEGTAWSVYTEVFWSITPEWALCVGARGGSYHRTTRNDLWISPSISLSWQNLSKKWTIRGDFSHSLQPVQQVNAQSVFLQSAFNTLPQDSQDLMRVKQGSIEFVWHPIPSLTFTVSPYFKQTKGLLALKDGTELKDFYSGTISGEGSAYGIEFLSEMNISRRSHATMSYTYGKSEQYFQEDNKKRQRYPSDFDFRHYIFSNVTFHLSHRLSLTGSWVFHTGGPQTLALESVEMADIPNSLYPMEKHSEQFPHRNNFRLPAYHRLDLGLSWDIPMRGRWSGELAASVYNVYNRMNCYRIVIEGKDDGGKSFRQMTMFPILPSISFKLNF